MEIDLPSAGKPLTTQQIARTTVNRSHTTEWDLFSMTQDSYLFCVFIIFI